MDTSDWIAIASALIALGALGWSIRTGREVRKWRPVPDLRVDWNPSARPHRGLFLRDVSIVNHGEAVARDVRAISSTSLAINGHTDWSADTLAPGERVTFTVPLVKNVGVMQNRDGAEEFYYSGRGEDFHTETPTLTLHWVQAPGSTACSLESTAPPSPVLGPQSEPPA